MKTFTLTFTLLLTAAAGPLFAQQSLEVRYPTYSLSAVASLKNRPDAELVPMLTGKVDSLGKKAEKNRFGFLFRSNAKSLGSTTILELTDAETRQSIKKISLEEYFGKETSGWKLVDQSSSSSASSIVSVFSIKQKDFEGTLTREMTVIQDRSLPAGKGIRVAFWLESKTLRTISATFHLAAEGLASSAGSLVIVASTEPAAQVNPMMTVSFSGAKQIQVEAPKKGKAQSITITTNTVQLAAEAKSQLLSFSVAGTNAWYGESVRRQAQNLAAYFSTGKTSPNVVPVTIADKPHASPRDTMTYTIYCQNLGTSVATGAEVSNPIPQGTTYVAGSAAGANTSISFEKTGETIAAIKWLFQDAIQAGEERSVTFKVVVR